MQPTLNPGRQGSQQQQLQQQQSDWVLVDKLTVKLLQQYTRGEVVVLW